MNRFRSLAALAFVASAALPMVVQAQQKYDMKIDDIGNPVTVFNQALGTGPAVGPYHLESTNPVISKFNAICIDLDNDVAVGSTWKARMLTFNEAINPTNLAAVTRALGGTPSWGLMELRASAILGQQFYTSPTSQWDEIHAAIWRMFSQGTPTPSNASQSATFQANALAQSDPTNGAFLGAGAWDSWRLIVDDNAWNSDFRGNLEQTFISTVPEPSTYLLMGTGLLAVGFAARRRRRSV